MKLLTSASLLIVLVCINLYGAPTILVTGGAGYIGSATTLLLLQKGYNVIVIDKEVPQSSFFARSPRITQLEEVDTFSFPAGWDELSPHVVFIQSDFADSEILTKLFSSHAIDAVIHFAGFIEVSRSCKDPESFYDNNVQKTFTLLKLMRAHGVNKCIFSSSAAVYGIPVVSPLTESCTPAPINPYGKTKLIVDFMLEDYVRAYNWKAVSLRYFNAAGALPDYDIGERHEPETHVIPLLLRAAFVGQSFTIFGDDYATPDGTCIRDYLHIYDLATAHYCALKYLESDGVSYEAINLGTGTGTSVKELVDCASRVTGLPITITIKDRRAGDPDRLVADPTKAQRVLGWLPTQSSLEHILRTAHIFEKKKNVSLIPSE